MAPASFAASPPTSPPVSPGSKPGEAFGVAHCCDDGSSALDLLPNRHIAQLNNGLAVPSPGAFQEIPNVVGHLALDTGGFSFHTPFGHHDPLIAAQALSIAVERLHSRYQLTWLPLHPDGQSHTLSVRLTRQARKAHPGLALQTRSYYVASPRH